MIGLIVRSDLTGLGAQTRRLARLLKPDKVMLIDSTSFNGNKQHLDWYKDYNTTIIDGFPHGYDVQKFCEGLDTVISCEIFYHNRFTDIARGMKVKTILIFNYEFFDWFTHAFGFISEPTKLVQPSLWHFDKMIRDYRAMYLPTPIFDDEFKNAREINLKRTGKPKYLFINGKTAVHDRNGLESLYRALELSKGDYTVTVKSQTVIAKHPDPRLIYDYSNPENQEELYKDFDALILPRRYGGQALSMCEALMSGLPVIMTDIDPNNKILPKAWLVSAVKTSEFMTRTLIDIYSADAQALADTLDTLDVDKDAKVWATNIGQQYEAENLRQQYMELLK